MRIYILSIEDDFVFDAFLCSSAVFLSYSAICLSSSANRFSRVAASFSILVTLFRNVFTYSGYKFAGWYYDENTTFEDKQYMLYDKAEDMTLTAIWKPDPQGQKSSELIIIVSSSVTFISLVTTVTTTIIVKRRKRRLKDE